MWGVAVLDDVRLEFAIALFFSSSIDVLSRLFDIKSLMRRLGTCSCSKYRPCARLVEIAKKLMELLVKLRGLISAFLFATRDACV